MGSDAPTIGAEEGDATPIVRIEPGTRCRLPGMVRRLCTIVLQSLETGEVDDVNVIKAEP